jgi:hypothetical protein
MWKPEGEVIKIIQNPPVASVVTKLNEKEEVLYASKKEQKNKVTEDIEVPWEDDAILDTDINEQDKIDALHQSCCSLKSLIDDFRRIVENKIHDGITDIDLKELLHNLEIMELDMEGSIRLIDN